MDTVNSIRPGLSVTTDRARIARRMAKLLDYLGCDARTFSDETGLDRSYVGRLLKGERGGGTGVKLLMSTEHRYGLSNDYWLSERELEPGECIRVAASKPTIQEMTAAQRQIRDEAIEAAIEAGAPSDVLKAMLHASPPAGQELSRSWWFVYFHECMINARRR